MRLMRREAVAAGTIEVLESPVHERESRPRPDLGLIELLRDLSQGRRLPAQLDRSAREVRRRAPSSSASDAPTLCASGT